jgi:hypothetical protein
MTIHLQIPVRGTPVKLLQVAAKHTYTKTGAFAASCRLHSLLLKCTVQDADADLRGKEGSLCTHQFMYSLV